MTDSSKKDKAAKKQGNQRTASQGGTPKPPGDKATNSNAQVWDCTVCSTIIDSDECKAMECERCSKHYCLKCIDMNDDAYTYMSRAEVLWCCKSCCKMVRKIMKEKTNPENQNRKDTKDILDKMKDLEQGINKLDVMEDKFNHLSGLMEDRMTRMEESMNDFNMHIQKATEDKDLTTEPTWASRLRSCIEVKETNQDQAHNKPLENIKTILKETIEEKEKESADIDKRVTNVIIFRAPEEETSRKGVQEENDKALITELLNSIECEDIEFSDATRLGIKESKSRDSCRPLRFKVPNENAKSRIMSNLFKIKHAPERIQSLAISHDLTKAQRDERRKKLEELKDAEVEEGYRLTV